MTTDLEELYRVTSGMFSATAARTSLNAEVDELVRALDWLDRVLCGFTQACRQSVAAGQADACKKWKGWLSGNGVEVIKAAGGQRIFEWRRDWLTTLVDTSAKLCRLGVGETVRLNVAAHLIADPPPLFQDLPNDFWRSLIDYLAGSPTVVEASCAITFPLVLSEPMVIDGNFIDVLLAEFQMIPESGGSGDLYPDPRQMAVRCFAPDFLAVFRRAAELAPSSPGTSHRVILSARQPDHEVFLQKLVLSGPSAGGALAAGHYLMTTGRSRRLHRNVAVSCALGSDDDRCLAVGGAYEKVRGCARFGVNRLIVANEQASQVAFYGHLQNVEIAGVESVTDLLSVLDESMSPEPVAATTAKAEVPAVANGAASMLALIPDDGGVLPLGSPLYLDRRSDEAFHEALGQRPMIVLVKGARQIGKTSLLVRGVDALRGGSIASPASSSDVLRAKLVYVDLQSIGRESLRSQRDLFSAISRIFSRELGLDKTMDDEYDERDGPNKNFENFLFRHALSSPVVWFMDEVDRLFEFEFYTDVFSLMRSWHNRRPIHEELANLTLVLSYATETHLLIEDAYQSPFNVGIKVELEDFTREQVADLNERLGRPLRCDADLGRFVHLVGGHPHLVCRGLSWMAHEGKGIDEFADRAALDNGPFGTHLRRLRVLTQNPELLSIVKDILRGGKCGSPDAFLHLRSAGVVVGDDCGALRMRCEIYAQYLRRHLLPEAQAALPVRASLWSRLLRREARR